MFFVTRATMLRPSEITQRETLAAAIAELLWKVGEGRRAILAIPEANPVFEASVRFSMDGLTEKVSKLKIGDVLIIFFSTASSVWMYKGGGCQENFEESHLLCKYK